MDQVLQEKCTKLIEGRDMMKKVSPLNFPQMRLLGGMLYMNSEQSITKKELVECRDILKRKTGILSNMRGIIELAVIVQMAAQPDPEEYIDRVLQAYDVLTAGKVFRSEYLVLTAMAIAENVEPQAYERVATATWALYGQMRAEHPLLTDQNDTTFAALLVIFGGDSEAVMNEMEACYENVSKGGFMFAKDTAQAVSQVLALSPRPTKEKSARFKELRNMLKSEGCKLHRGPELAIIAAFNDVDISNEQIVSEIVEVEAWLKKQRGMGILGVGSQLRRVMACVIVLEAHKNDRSYGATSAASSSLASSITTQIVMTIIMVIIIVSVNMAINASTSS